MITPSTTSTTDPGATGPRVPRVLAAQTIVMAVADAFGVTTHRLTGPGRLPEMVDARKVAIWLLARRGLGPTAIGRLIGRDHSTVLHHQCIRLSDEQRIMLADLARELGLPRRPRPTTADNPAAPDGSRSGEATPPPGHQRPDPARPGHPSGQGSGGPAAPRGRQPHARNHTATRSHE